MGCDKATFRVPKLKLGERFVGKFWPCFLDLLSLGFG